MLARVGRFGLVLAVLVKWLRLFTLAALVMLVMLRELVALAEVLRCDLEVVGVGTVGSNRGG